ncbi:hypothetical protein BCR42DRAFT_416736 [Absidia repens]|uniref:PH domain-containing protein n=1 Tax=Absidia repens TaxID=90262 RepID=A0A1X2IF17_9FUNG|nr:hypothetical protein BCR42DRAFT_416736 [Absidia repens]
MNYQQQGDDDEADDNDDGGGDGEEDGQGDDIQEQQHVMEYGYATTGDDLQSDQSSFMSSPSVITMASQPTHFGSTQEFKVAREGWLYKKNSLMQWRPVYAVAKHGNAIKPGALYLYKDDKFANHIHTYDMSEVVEVEPKKQDYRPGIKWELRLLVKRDDVLLATDDVTTRKDWINSLTSIMGKVSLATHSELQSRTVSMEQLNRQLQATNASLEQDNTLLRQELTEAQKRERSLASEHTARESGLVSELEHVRQQLEQAEQDLAESRSKADDLEKQKMTWQAKAQDCQEQAHDWRERVAVLEDEKDHLLDEKDMLVDEKEQLLDEKERLLDEKEQQWRMMNAATSYHNVSNSNSSSSGGGGGGRSGGRRNHIKQHANASMGSDDDGGMMVIRDVKYHLESLRDQIKDPLLQSHVLDIKSGLLEVEGDDRARLLDTFQSEFANMRESSLGDYSQLQSILADLQSSQTTLLETVVKNDSAAIEDAIKVWQDEQKRHAQNMVEQQQQWLDDMQGKILDQVKATKNASSSGKGEFTMMESTQDPQAHQKYILSTLETHLDALKDGQDQSREEYDKSFKVLGQLFQHVIQQVDDIVVPDVSHHLDELADRMATIDQRLHRIQLMKSNSDGGGDSLAEMQNLGHGSMEDEDIRELVIGTRGFMERTLRVLDRFGGSQSGLEETVRRAVKNAFNSHLDVNWNDPHQNEEKLKRYEENARGYIDKAMSGMRGHLEDYTGVMYKMIEDLILRAVQHLDNNTSGGGDDNSKEDKGATSYHQEQQQQRLVADIERLTKERDDLETLVKQLGKENNQVAVELAKKKTELQSTTSEYERVQRQIQQARHDSLAAMARDLDPLVRQINMLKQSVQGGPDGFYSDDSDQSGGYIDLGPMTDRGRSSARSSTSLSPTTTRSTHLNDHHQQEEKQHQRRSYTNTSSSTSRDRSSTSSTSTNTPLSTFLNRK